MTSPAQTRHLAHRTPMAVAAAALLMLGWAQATQAETIDTVAKHAYLLDYQTGAVLLNKDASAPMPPSSMSKLMTAYMVFDKLKSGAWKLTDPLPVSEAAWKKHYKSDGSMMYVAVNSMVTVEDLLRGMIIQSGNDACSVLAEAHSGSEEAFAEAMTKKARELGMKNSTFRNASGLPEEGHLMSPQDLAILSTRIIKDFPEYYHFYSEKDFTYNNIKQGNRNPLLYRSMGADGLKTGHSSVAGYGLTASVQRGDRRLILVVNGLPSMQSRADESARLIEWGFREFDNYKLFEPGAVVTEADVWLGQQVKVPLTSSDSITVTLPRRVRDQMVVKAVYDGPIPAPIKKGDQVGKLVVTAPGEPDREIPLVAAADVQKLGFFGRISAAVKHILWGPGA